VGSEVVVAGAHFDIDTRFLAISNKLPNTRVEMIPNTSNADVSV
jgi:hypothetical protein